MKRRASLLASLVLFAGLSACQREVPPAAPVAGTRAPSDCPTRAYDEREQTELQRAEEASIDLANAAAISMQQAQAAIGDANDGLAQVGALDDDAAAPMIGEASAHLAEVATAHHRYDEAMARARDALANLREPASVIAARRPSDEGCLDGDRGAEGIRRDFDERQSDLEATFASVEKAGESLVARQDAAEDRLAQALAAARHAEVQP